MNWAHGIAELVNHGNRYLVIRCPHCGASHKHPTTDAGSREVLAGCHRGFARSRSYAIPDRAKR